MFSNTIPFSTLSSFFRSMHFDASLISECKCLSSKTYHKMFGILKHNFLILSHIGLHIHLEPWLERTVEQTVSWAALKLTHLHSIHDSCWRNPEWNLLKLSKPYILYHTGCLDSEYFHITLLVSSTSSILSGFLFFCSFEGINLIKTLLNTIWLSNIYRYRFLVPKNFFLETMHSNLHFV